MRARFASAAVQPGVEKILALTYDWLKAQRGTLSMAYSADVIKAVNELINAQADQLWTISISVIVAEIFIIAHLMRMRSVTIRPRLVAAVIGISAMFHVLALASGYLSKGALIDAMIKFAKGGDWKFPDYAALFNITQVGFVTIGLVIFVICFFFYSRELAQAITMGGKK